MMTGLVLGVVMQVSLLGASAPDYASAWKSSQENGQPMLVLVSAEWCPACQVLKSSTLPRLLRAGKLKNLNFTVVDTDKETKLASKIMSGGSLPQLIVYKPTKEGWRRSHMIGAQGDAEVESFIRRAVAAKTKPAKP
jgi:thiol-disulfide isomerase/thioredoxin